MKIIPNTKYKAVIHLFEHGNYACLHYYDSNNKWITSSPSFLKEDINEIFEQFRKDGKLQEYKYTQDKIQIPYPEVEPDIELEAYYKSFHENNT